MAAGGVGSHWPYLHSRAPGGGSRPYEARGVQFDDDDDDDDDDDEN